MSEPTNSELLGETLRQADLVSFPQIQVALTDQEFNQENRLGEILATRGWIKQQTADFFADQWQPIIRQSARLPLGNYFEHSGLLTPEQTNAVLQEQQRLWLKFGSTAVIQGLITQKTLDFFLANLFPWSTSASATKAKKSQLDVALGEFESDRADNPKQLETGTTAEDIDYDDIPWID